MKTTKAISTISYNSRPFLIGKLNDLIENGFIDFWVLIKHQKEDDETKDHFHVYIEPAKSVDTNALGKYFQELDALSTKPLGVMPFRKTKFADWYWYGLHDASYLLSKGESRKHHYKASDMISSNDDFLGEMVRTNPKPQSEQSRVVEMLKKGYSAMDIAMALNVPVRYLKNALEGIEIAMASAGRHQTYRNGKQNHEKVDVFDDNGELKEEK